MTSPAVTFNPDLPVSANAFCTFGSGGNVTGNLTLCQTKREGFKINPIKRALDPMSYSVIEGSITIKNSKSQMHGFHVHTVEAPSKNGKCETNGQGKHYNPKGVSE